MAMDFSEFFFKCMERFFYFILKIRRKAFEYRQGFICRSIRLNRLLTYESRHSKKKLAILLANDIEFATKLDPCIVLSEVVYLLLKIIIHQCLLNSYCVSEIKRFVLTFSTRDKTKALHPVYFSLSSLLFLTSQLPDDIVAVAFIIIVEPTRVEFKDFE